MNISIEFDQPQTFKTLRVRGDGSWPHRYITIGLLNEKQFDEILKEWTKRQKREHEIAREKHLGATAQVKL